MSTWDMMSNWNLVLPPSRPSRWQLDWIANHVRKFDLQQPVAILGSTPEFRDHLCELGFKNIYVFDKNLAFFQQMSNSRIYRNEETFVHGDWLDTLSDYQSKFSIILSDLTSGNIDYSDRKRFYSLITNSLSQHGIFCDKVLTHPNTNLRLENLFEKYEHLPLNLVYINYFSCEVLFCSELLDIDYLVDTTRFYRLLAETIKSPRVKAFAQQAQLITPINCLWFYGKKWVDLEKDYCYNMDRIDEIDDSEESPYFKRVKFFVHRRR